MIKLLVNGKVCELITVTGYGLAVIFDENDYLTFVDTHDDRVEIKRYTPPSRMSTRRPDEAYCPCCGCAHTVVDIGDGDKVSGCNVCKIGWKVWSIEP